mgnify:CR=1 FL=1
MNPVATDSSRWSGPAGPTKTVSSENSTESLSTADRARPDALALYMRAVGEVPLLTAPQEIELATRIRRGDAAARDWMIRANLRFVIKIAREYENLGLPLLDLINEGNIGQIGRAHV